MIILFRVTAKVDMMKMFGSADSDGQMPLMITSQDDKPGLSTYKATQIVAWENSRHFATPPLVSLQNDVWETSAEISYWWRVTSQTWVVRLIGWKFAPTNQKHYPDLGGDALSVRNLCTRLSNVISRENQWWRCKMSTVFLRRSNCLKWDTVGNRQSFEVAWKLPFRSVLSRECSRITVFFADQHLALFNASFETNPLDGKCDQRAVVSSQPVKVIYDAVSSY